MKRPYEYFLNINSSEILRAVSGDVIGVYAVYEFGFYLVSELLNVAFIGALLIYQDWFMAVGVLLVSGICFISVIVFFRYLRYAKYNDATIINKSEFSFVDVFLRG